LLKPFFAQRSACSKNKMHDALASSWHTPQIRNPGKENGKKPKKTRKGLEK